MNYITYIVLLGAFLVQGSSSTEGQDLLTLISTSLRSESVPLHQPSSVSEPTTENPVILSDPNSEELPEIPQIDSLVPTKKPKFVSIFAGNISFAEQNLTYYASLLKETIPPQHRLEYLDAISDRMRQENKFQQDDWLSEFAEIFYWLLQTHKNLPQYSWSKKTERKILKRFLKYALASESLTKTFQNALTCEDLQPSHFLTKEFFVSLVALSEEEGYAILMEVLQNRNATLTTEQLQDLQCLYYNSFQGMQNGRAYVFSQFDDDWDRRNSIFGKPLILDSIRAMIAEETGTPKEPEDFSDFMNRILSILPEYRSKLEEEKKSENLKKTPKKFHDVVKNLLGKLMGIEKSDVFVDVDSKDVIMSTGVEALLDKTGDVFDPEKFPVVFDPFNRHDWNQLQKLRWAGIQIFDKYDKFFSRLVTDKITRIYSGRGLSRTFSNAFHHIRLLPTGSLILQGFETLNALMEGTPPRDAVTQEVRIKNFKQTLQFLRGLYSTNDALLTALPQQVQTLTDPNLNKNLKLMLKYAPQHSKHAPSEENMIFTEVGVSNGTLAIRPFPYFPNEGDAPFVNSWQFNLGYFKGYSEAWQEPVIKAEILLANETRGGLGYKWRDGLIVYGSGGSEETGAKDIGFWDLSLSPSNQSFQLMYQGKLEIFFTVLFDPTGMTPIGLKGAHHVPHHLPEGFRPAEFFVVPSEDFY